MRKTIFLLFLLLLFLSCKRAQQNFGGKINISATTGMIADVVKNIGGNRVNVTALMGPGIDPHLYRARISDIANLFKANLIFYNGLHLEAKLADVLKKINIRKKNTYAVAEAIEKTKLRKLDKNQYDMHVWMDVSLWMIAAKEILRIITMTDPTNSEYYQRNAEKYFLEMEMTHQYILKRISEIPAQKRVLITAHDAFNYFSAAYRIEVKAIQGVSTDAEASAQDIRLLADFIAKRKIPAIFVESTVPLKTIEALREAVNARGYTISKGGELLADAMGNQHSPSGTYLGMMRYNADTIANSLNH